MPIVSTGALIDVLREHGLLPADKLAELPHVWQGRCGDARAMARILMQRGWLTIYQVNQILTGHAAQLVFGPYHALDRLGQGGLSSVYKARHKELNLLVALKVLNPEILTSTDGRQQFLQEIEAMAALDHPNVVQFCDADQIGDTCFFAMEYVDGTDLGKLVQLGGPVSVRDACDYICQTAMGLQHAHERNLVHRDIKPVNLFLTHAPAAIQAAASRGGILVAPDRPLIKILDWGLAGLRAPSGAQEAENVACVVGTADYLSPEQARQAGSVDIRGDIYSLGCTFYFLLTGQPPYPDGTLMQKVMQHQTAEPKPVETFRDDVPDSVIAILRRMTAKKPEDRFQTPAAVGLALRPHARGETPRSGTIPLPPKTKSAGPSVTPLPIALGGKPGENFTRLSKAGPERGGDAFDDTSCPPRR